MKKQFTKKDTQMANKHMKRQSTSLATGEPQIKTTMSYYYTPIRMTKPKAHEDAEKLDHSSTARGI